MREDGLWRLPNAVTQLALAEFEWLLDLPLWRWQGRRFQVSVRQVFDDRQRYAAHVEKAVASDLSYPIHVARHRGRLVILDGYHRLLKSMILGRATIGAIEVQRSDLSS